MMARSSERTRSQRTVSIAAMVMVALMIASPAHANMLPLALGLLGLLEVLLLLALWIFIKALARYLRRRNKVADAEDSDEADRLRPGPQTVRRSRRNALIASALVLMGTPAGALFTGDWLWPALVGGAALLAVCVWYAFKVGILFLD
jgi:hypothetical protein